jgi:hypothetical protein
MVIEIKRIFSFRMILSGMRKENPFKEQGKVLGRLKTRYIEEIKL